MKRHAKKKLKYEQLQHAPFRPAYEPAGQFMQLEDPVCIPDIKS